MAFWGVLVNRDKPYTLRCDGAPKRLRISQATLEDRSGIWSGRSVVRCTVGNKSTVYICSLSIKDVHSCQLDLEFEESEDVVFSVSGPRGVHLAGYFLNSPITTTTNACKINPFEEEDIEKTEAKHSSDYKSQENEHHLNDSFIDDTALHLLPTSHEPPQIGAMVEELDSDKNTGGVHVESYIIGNMAGASEQQFIVVERENEVGKDEAIVRSAEEKLDRIFVNQTDGNNKIDAVVQDGNMKGLIHEPAHVFCTCDFQLNPTDDRVGDCEKQNGDDKTDERIEAKDDIIDAGIDKNIGIATGSDCNIRKEEEICRKRTCTDGSSAALGNLVKRKKRRTKKSEGLEQKIRPCIYRSEKPMVEEFDNDKNLCRTHVKEYNTGSIKASKQEFIVVERKNGMGKSEAIIQSVKGEELGREFVNQDEKAHGNHNTDAAVQDRNVEEKVTDFSVSRRKQNLKKTRMQGSEPRSNSTTENDCNYRKMNLDLQMDAVELNLSNRNPCKDAGNAEAGYPVKREKKKTKQSISDKNMDSKVFDKQMVRTNEAFHPKSIIDERKSEAEKDNMTAGSTDRNIRGTNSMNCMGDDPMERLLDYDEREYQICNSPLPKTKVGPGDAGKLKMKKRAKEKLTTPDYVLNNQDQAVGYGDRETLKDQGYVREIINYSMPQRKKLKKIRVGEGTQGKTDLDIEAEALESNSNLPKEKTSCVDAGNAFTRSHSKSKKRKRKKITGHDLDDDEGIFDEHLEKCMASNSDDSLLEYSQYIFKERKNSRGTGDHAFDSAMYVTDVKARDGAKKQHNKIVSHRVEKKNNIGGSNDTDQKLKEMQGDYNDTKNDQLQDISLPSMAFETGHNKEQKKNKKKYKVKRLKESEINPDNVKDNQAEDISDKCGIREKNESARYADQNVTAGETVENVLDDDREEETKDGKVEVGVNQEKTTEKDNSVRHIVLALPATLKSKSNSQKK